MSKKILIISTILLLVGSVCWAFMPVMPGETVAVLPLTFHYQVVQEFSQSYEKTDSYLKGYFREGASASSSERDREREHHGVVSDSYSEDHSSRDRYNASGKYNLRGGSTTVRQDFNDTTVVEKMLKSNAFSGVLASSLSESGIKMVDNETVRSVAQEFNNAPSAKKGKRPHAQRTATYALTGNIESMKLEGIRRVPDGTNERFSVSARMTISIKLVNLRDSTVSFARTFTGIGKKTFNGADPVPVPEVLDGAMSDLAAKLVESFTGIKQSTPNDDSEYQDSPGKQLVQ
ncbi:MAG: hypothetical protein HQL03_00485 [Nitrospirae bacterium]|nr:hypothetical protein [Nitrospirota bacterium]